MQKTKQIFPFFNCISFGIYLKVITWQEAVSPWYPSGLGIKQGLRRWYQGDTASCNVITYEYIYCDTTNMKIHYHPVYDCEMYNNIFLILLIYFFRASATASVSSSSFILVRSAPRFWHSFRASQKLTGSFWME